jgi:hypothetical protein
MQIREIGSGVSARELRERSSRRRAGISTSGWSGDWIVWGQRMTDLLAM